MKRELIIVLDFGGQYNQLIARRVRECNVYCEIYSYKKDLEEIKAMNPKGIILTGGPNSCYEPGAPTCDKRLFQLGIPILGICYGAQLMMHVLGGRVEKAPIREYGKTEVIVDKSDSSIFEGVSSKTTCWMSHFDYVSRIATGFEITAHTVDCPVAAAESASEGLYAIQYHPEVLHSIEGSKMLSNFVYNVCGCSGDWKMDSFVEHSIVTLREKIERLEQLFLPVGNYKKTRVNFWKMVTELFSDAYMRQIFEWCDERGLKLTGHLTSEQSMLSQLTAHGACMPHYEYFHIPGMDWLGRDIWKCLII